MKLINPTSEAGARDLVNLFCETALINSGFTLENTGTFAERIFRIVQMGLGLDPEFNEVVEAVKSAEGIVVPRKLSGRVCEKCPDP